MKKHFLLIASLFLLTGCPEPVIHLANIDGERNFVIYNSEGLEFKIDEASVNKFGKISIPIRAENYTSYPVKLQIENSNIHFINAEIYCDNKCISSIAYSQRDLNEDTRPMQWHSIGFTEPPSGNMLDIEVKPNQLMFIELSIMIPDEYEIGRRNLNRMKKYLDNESIDVSLGKLSINEEEFFIEKFSLHEDGR